MSIVKHLDTDRPAQHTMDHRHHVSQEQQDPSTKASVLQLPPSAVRSAADGTILYHYLATAFSTM